MLVTDRGCIIRSEGVSELWRSAKKEVKLWRIIVCYGIDEGRVLLILIWIWIWCGGGRG